MSPSAPGRLGGPGIAVRGAPVEIVFEDRPVRAIEGETVAADCVVLAMGPWSPTWLGLPQAFGTKYHSLLMRPERTLSQSVFFQG